MSLWTKVRAAFAGTEERQPAGRARSGGGASAGNQHRTGDPDVDLGTGLWRQHHDRFARAVDRFYETAVAVQKDADIAAGSTALEGDNSIAVARAAETLARLTAVLGGEAGRVENLVADLHARFPLAGQVVPAEVRSHVGDLPELLSRAARTAAEAGQAASMARVAIRTGTDPLGAARSAETYAAKVGDLVEACTAELRGEGDRE